MTNSLEQSESGFAHLLLIVAVLGVMGLMVSSNLEMMHQLTASRPEVRGVLLARGEDSGQNSGTDSQNNGSRDSKLSNPGNSNVGQRGDNQDLLKVNPPVRVKKLELNDRNSTSSAKNRQESGNNDGEHNNVDDQVQNQIGDHNVNQIQFKNNGRKLEIETRDATGSARKLTGVEATGSGKFRIKLASASAKLKDVELEENNNGLTLISKGEAVNIRFPISLDKTTGELTVQTGNGSKVIRVLPDQASEIAKNAGVQTRLEEIQLTTSSGGLVFKVQGQRTINILGFIPVTIPVSSDVNAETGVVTTDQPWWANLSR